MPRPLNIPLAGAVVSAAAISTQPKDVQRALPIFGGTTEIQREIIARSLGL
jgi:hypothetical protein